MLFASQFCSLKFESKTIGLGQMRAIQLVFYLLARVLF